MLKEKIRTGFNQARDTKTGKCYSDNPPYCRNHGAAQPKTVNQLQTLDKEVDNEIVKAKHNFDLKTVSELKETKTRIATELAAIKTIATGVTDTTVDATDLRSAMKNKRAEYRQYAKNLADQVFDDENERILAIKGDPAHFAAQDSQSCGYPTAKTGREWSDPEDVKNQTEVKKFAQDNNLQVAYREDNISSSTMVVFDAKKYGATISMRDMDKLSETKEFNVKHRRFAQACAQIMKGEAASNLAHNNKK